MNGPLDSATRSVLGVDADLLAVGAAVLGPLVAVLVGLLVFRYQQQAQYGAERFITQGLQKLYGTLSILLSIHLQNYQVGTYIIRTVRLYESDHPFAPDAGDIPGFLGLQLESLPIDSLLAVQELLGDKVILDWVMLALSDVTLEAKEMDFQIRQPIAAYYRKPTSIDSETREKVAEALTLVLDGWNTRVSAHFALRDRLHDLDNHVGKKRPWTLGGYYDIRNRPDVKGIVKEMKKGLCQVRIAHNQTAEVLKTGGYTA